MYMNRDVEMSAVLQLGYSELLDHLELCLAPTAGRKSKEYYGIWLRYLFGIFSLFIFGYLVLSLVQIRFVFVFCLSSI